MHRASDLFGDLAPIKLVGLRLADYHNPISVAHIFNVGPCQGHGVCRWCHAHAASIELTWQRYCLDSYLVAIGQKPGIQVTMCEGCGVPAAELDHRLAINMARALGSDALRRAFTIENLGWLCRECHRRKTRLDWRLARFLRACSLDWRRAIRVWRLNRRWAGAFIGTDGTTVAQEGLRDAA